MPQTKVNGFSSANGHNGYEMEDGASFLFTSESVGEGHPGNWIHNIIISIIILINSLSFILSHPRAT